MEHYRCHKIYTPKTIAERVAKIVDFFPHYCATPYASPLDDATRADDSLADALKGNQVSDPYDAPGNEQLMAIKKLSHIFSQLVASRKKETSFHGNAESPSVTDITVTSPRVKVTTDTPPKLTHTKPTNTKVAMILPNPKTPSEHSNLPHVIPYEPNDIDMSMQE